MSITVDDNTAQQLHKMLQELAQFIALYEQSDDHLKVRKEQLDNQVTAIGNEIQLQVQQVQEVVAELNEVMTETGAARWRIAAEKSLSLGEDHLKAIRETCNVYKKLADDSVSRLEQTAVLTEKRVTNALKHLTEDNFAVVDEFQRRTEETYHRLDKQSKGALESMKRLLKWFRWDRIGIAVLAGFLASLLTSIYVNAELPWDSHSKAVQERMIGKALLTTWPRLSKAKQNDINTILGTNVS